MELVAKVSDCFHIAGRGVVLMFEWASPTGKVRVGNEIQLKAPNGDITNAKICGVEHVKRLKPCLGNNLALMLAPPLHNKEFERDTEIWVLGLNDSNEKGIERE